MLKQLHAFVLSISICGASNLSAQDLMPIKQYDLNLIGVWHIEEISLLMNESEALVEAYVLVKNDGTYLFSTDQNEVMSDNRELSDSNVNAGEWFTADGAIFIRPYGDEEWTIFDEYNLVDSGSLKVAQISLTKLSDISNGELR